MEVVAYVLLITGLICIAIIIGSKYKQHNRDIQGYSITNETSFGTMEVDCETRYCSSIDIGDMFELNPKSIDPLFESASRFVVDCQQCSASEIQRQFSIGFNRAGHLVDQLEAAGIVGPCNQFGKPRQVLVHDLVSLESILTNLQPIIIQAREKEAELEEARQIVNEQIERQEIAAHIKEKYRRRQLEKIVRQELIDSGELFGEQSKRPQIPREVVDAVYKWDGGRCVYCGSTQNLQLDHIIPFSRGGATTLENLQLLCQKCNIEKSNKIG